MIIILYFYETPALAPWLKNTSLVNQTLNKTGNLNPARQTNKQFKSGPELERFHNITHFGLRHYLRENID
jgi:hypothetical protein